MKYLEKVKNSIFKINNSSGQIGTIIFFLSLVLLSIFIVKSATLQSPILALGLVSGLIIALITLVNTDLALAILIFSMLLSPEIPLAQVSERAVVIRIEDFLIFFMFFTWLTKTTINRELGLLKYTPLNIPIIAYILVCILSTALGRLTGHINLLESFFYILKYIEYFMLFFMVSNNIHSKEQVKNFIIIFLITCLLTCIYAIATAGQFVSGRASAPFEGPAGEPNTLGGYLVILFAITTGLFLYSPSRIWRFFCLGLACLVSLTILKTLSRGSYLAFVVAYLALAFFSRRKKLLLTGILVLGILLLPTILPVRVIERVTNTFIPGIVYEPLGYRVALEPSSASRVERSKNIIKLWTQRPLLGYGVTGVGLVDTQYPRVLGELGLVGFLIFLWLILTVIRYTLRNFNKIEDDWAKGLSLGFLAGFIGLLAHSFGANTFIIVRIMEPLWFLAAIIISLPRLFIPLEQEEIEAKNA